MQPRTEGQEGDKLGPQNPNMPMVCLSACPVGETEAREKEGPAAPASVPRVLSLQPSPVTVAWRGVGALIHLTIRSRTLETLGNSHFRLLSSDWWVAGGGTVPAKTDPPALGRPGHPRGPVGPNSKLASTPFLWAQHHAEPGSPSGPPQSSSWLYLIDSLTKHFLMWAGEIPELGCWQNSASSAVSPFCGPKLLQILQNPAARTSGSRKEKLLP